MQLINPAWPSFRSFNLLSVFDLINPNKIASFKHRCSLPLIASTNIWRIPSLSALLLHHERVTSVFRRIIGIIPWKCLSSPPSAIWRMNTKRHWLLLVFRSHFIFHPSWWVENEVMSFLVIIIFFIQSWIFFGIDGSVAMRWRGIGRVPCQKGHRWIFSRWIFGGAFCGNRWPRLIPRNRCRYRAEIPRARRESQPTESVVRKTMEGNVPAGTSRNGMGRD